MSMAARFREQLASFAEEMSRRNLSAVLLGAGRGGWYMAQVLKQLDIRIAAFADSNPRRQGVFCGVDVLSPKAAVEIFPDAVFLPCLLDPKNLVSVTTMLQESGASDIRYLMAPVLFGYYTEVANRNCDHLLLADAIARFYYREEGRQIFLSPSVSYPITQKCTLCCKDCGAFVPENPDPASYPASRVIADMQKYCSAFDIVHHIALQGGEPFMHREIEKIMDQVSRIPNLLFVDIVTNGTLVPKKSVLDAIATNGGCVIVSDYGAASAKIAPLADACREHGIFVDYYHYDENNEWGAQTPIVERGRDAGENNSIFRACVANPMICCQIMNGKVHRCSFSNFATDLNLIPEFTSDSVDIAQHAEGSPELTAELRALAYRDTALNACDHCPGWDRVSVPAGIQLTKPRKKRKTGLTGS